MAPASITKDGLVEITLDEHTRAVAVEAARVALREHMATCPILREFRELREDFYGKLGEKEEHPGVMGHVISLISWRSRVRRWFWWVVGGVPMIAAALITALWHWWTTRGATP